MLLMKLKDNMLTYPVELQINDSDWSKISNDFIINKYKNILNVKLIKDIKDFRGEVCFNYAIKDHPEYIEYCDQAYEYLERHYETIDLKTAQEGDIISYHSGEPSEENAQHFAIISETDGTFKGTYITSKWGAWGVFETDLEALPECYGEQIVIWRKKGE